MAYTNLDLWILSKILDKQFITTWKLAKEYKWESLGIKGFINNFRYISNKTHVIEYRLKNMIKSGIVEISKNGNTKFIIDNKKVIKKRSKFPDGYHNSICILEGNSWTIFQI